MAAWPELDELKQVLDITSDDWDGESIVEDTTRLTRLLAAAIAKVKLDVGDWDEYEDQPDEMLSQAALRMAELLAARADGPVSLRLAPALIGSATDPTYLRLLFGHRRSFGVA
jgi:hypothetical protein